MVSQARLLTEPRSHHIPREIPVESVPWSEFLPDMPFYQGEHVTIAAPTGWGKSTLGLEILNRRKYVVILATKPKDATLRNLQGYKVTREWNPIPGIHPRVIFWPKVDQTGKVREQRDAFATMLESVYEKGGWCVYIDELDYICNYLKLSPLVELLWRQGRSLDISVVAGTQRPAFVPLLAYDQASHLFIGRDNDSVNIRRYRALGGGNEKEIGRAIQSLQPIGRSDRGNLYGEFLYLSTREDGYMKTYVE